MSIFVTVIDWDWRVVESKEVPIDPADRAARVPFEAGLLLGLKERGLAGDDFHLIWTELEVTPEDIPDIRRQYQAGRLDSISYIDDVGRYRKKT